MKDDPAPIRVAFSLGVADCHWSCQKLRALKRMHGDRPIHVYVNEDEDHKPLGYLEIVTEVDEAHLAPVMPFRHMVQHSPHHDDEKHWSQLSNVKGLGAFDYVFPPMVWLESRQRIEQWLPELETEYDIQYHWTKETQRKSTELMEEPTAVLHLGRVASNLRHHGNWWSPNDWVEIIQGLNKEGVRPLIVGMDNKGYLDYYESVTGRLDGHSYRSVFGLADLADLCLLMNRCRCWIGLVSGLEIVSASMRTPTVAMWSDRRYPVGSFPLWPEAQSCWLSEEQLATYRPFSFGSAELTPARVVEAAHEIMR